ncbi:type-F conjugative transfer system protein TraW [Orientia tsutsugamushi]|uniref:Type-F conjugative transfer system protein TraW n=1 Tax=Orientia tsutsugamushi TaxID=784 RepID=A0A2U3RBL8_ORITS|nr:conjugative transfer domain protein [Orientia tsutsugamushi str. Karp]KJV74468.1 conjugative transfer domain protein [Orientia tsutsugamushi str. TA763]SPP24984.1 type-F conjugative transfer system protein TraW [Orientia tsutsugamushi]SPR10626.1 type-F conjugative transfer system protein TraW [Orientia tsutsugamushi]SPR15747.1 type-F conjugative transfer system protein TraW [Orientia tsutsugamushi]
MTTQQLTDYFRQEGSASEKAFENSSHKIILKQNSESFKAMRANPKLASFVDLVNGNPIELSNLLGRHIFFDQLGMLIRKFKIQAVPAIIEQENNVIKISEISTY